MRNHLRLMKSVILWCFIIVSPLCLSREPTPDNISLISQTKSPSSLTLFTSVHSIPFFTSDNFSEHTLQLSKNSLTEILASHIDEENERSSLISFMQRNRYQVVVIGSDFDIGSLDENEFPEEKTALISSQGMQADSYLTETLRLVARARIDQLREGAEKGNEHFKSELQSLNRAITAMNKNGFYLESDDEDDIDQPGYIVLSAMVLAGQFKAYFDRISGVLNKLFRKIAEREGGDFDSSDFDNELRGFRPWYEVSPDNFRQQAPEICEWLRRNKLSSTNQAISSDPIEIDNDIIAGFLQNPFNEDE